MTRIIISLGAVCAFALGNLDAVDLNFHLLWESTTSRGNPAANRAQSVAVSHNRTIVGEVLGRPDNSGTDIAVKGFNSTTGHLVWADEFPGFGIRVDVAHGEVVAAASIPKQADGSNVLLRGYNAQDGAILWTTLAELDQPQQILFRGGKLAIVGYGNGSDPITGIIRVFDAATGQKLWAVEEIQPYIIPLKDTVFWDSDDAGHHLIVLGTVGPGVDRDVILRSYRFRDGLLEWSTTVEKTFAGNLQVSNGEAFVAGFESSGSYLAAFDIGTGGLLWKATANPNEALNSLDVTDSRIVVGSPAALRVYDRATKALLFSKSPSTGTEDGVFRALALPNDRFLELSFQNLNPPSNSSIRPVIRILDNAGNALVETFPNAGFNDVAISGNRITIVGSSSAGALVRSYQIE